MTTINSMNPDVLIVRHPEEGISEKISKIVNRQNALSRCCQEIYNTEKEKNVSIYCFELSLERYGLKRTTINKRK